MPNMRDSTTNRVPNAAQVGMDDQQFAGLRLGQFAVVVNG